MTVFWDLYDLLNVYPKKLTLEILKKDLTKFRSMADIIKFDGPFFEENFS